jgi:hypothetical protein
MLDTSAKFTLADIHAKFGQGADSASTRSATSSASVGVSTDASGSPQLNRLYVATNGAMAIVEQQGGSVVVSFSTREGYIYGRSRLQWDSVKRGFFGTGTMKAVCGSYDTRITDALIEEEIYIVSSGAIRDRWTNPDKLNCSKGIVTSYSWQEILWYVPNP